MKIKKTTSGKYKMYRTELGGSVVSMSAYHAGGYWLEPHPTPGFFIQNIHSKSKICDDMMMFSIIVLSGIVTI